jgi:hypothetical protein
MRRSQKFANPFYGLLIVVGVTFALTAVAYGVMAWREAATVRAADEHSSSAEKHPLTDWMSRHGNTALVIELSLLAVCTFGAIGTDEYWQRRGAQRRLP